MAIAYMNSTAFAADSTTTTSSSFDTTGATLIVLTTTYWNNNPGTPTDSKGNTYTGLTVRGAAYANQQMWYCVAPVVGSGHTFTQPSSASSNNVSASVIWFSGTATSSAFDVESGGGTLSASITPSQDNSVIVFAGADYYEPAAPISVSGGFTKVQDLIAAGPQEPACVAYLIQTTAATVTPAWTFSGTPRSQVHTIAVFKPGAGGGGGSNTPMGIITPNQGIVLASAARRFI